jgi:hypothetical protein
MPPQYFDVLKKNIDRNETLTLRSLLPQKAKISVFSRRFAVFLTANRLCFLGLWEKYFHNFVTSKNKLVNKALNNQIIQP